MSQGQFMLVYPVQSVIVVTQLKVTYSKVTIINNIWTWDTSVDTTLDIILVDMALT